MNFALTLIQVVGAILTGWAVLHTTPSKIRTPDPYSPDAPTFGKVEVVFGFWLMVLMRFMFAAGGHHETDANAVFFGPTALAALADNAALAYLSSLMGPWRRVQVALLAGAGTGDILTLISNPPNLADAAILKAKFVYNSTHPLGLLLGSLPPRWLRYWDFVRCINQRSASTA